MYCGRTLPQRIRAGCDVRLLRCTPPRLPLPQRIRAGCDAFDVDAACIGAQSLPQRIRAGCDVIMYSSFNPDTYLCHSAFARVATFSLLHFCHNFDLCHSAFARVATCNEKTDINAHIFATAHSRGLRPYRPSHPPSNAPLPQRIRAGCDSHIGFYVGNLVGFATAHSRGLRR